MPGKGTLTLTGLLGESMRESAQAALSYLRSHAKAMHLDVAKITKTDLHIHVPAGAVPKDGPSAGVAIAAALMSLFRHRAIHQEMAMTGEVTLTGRVLPGGRGPREGPRRPPRRDHHRPDPPAQRERPDRAARRGQGRRDLPSTTSSATSSPPSPSPPPPTSPSPVGPETPPRKSPGKPALPPPGKPTRRPRTP